MRIFYYQIRCNFANRSLHNSVTFFTQWEHFLSNSHRTDQKLLYAISNFVEKPYLITSGFVLRNGDNWRNFTVKDREMSHGKNASDLFYFSGAEFPDATFFTVWKVRIVFSGWSENGFGLRVHSISFKLCGNDG